MKFKFLEGSATPLFHIRGTSLPARSKRLNCVWLGVLLLAKLNLLCLKMLVVMPFFGLQLILS